MCTKLIEHIDLGFFMEPLAVKTMINSKYLSISKDVQHAISAGRPVVALESTIISHGMPYPRNVETALGLEALIRDYGAVPATIALIDKKIKVGLSVDEIEVLATAKDVKKVSRRDIPFVLADANAMGACTVAATMIAADMAGIRVFATGGIGGVHRAAQQSFDVSADLQELSQTNVAVVCAGVKSILDLPLTCEVLETLGVPIAGYQTDCLPSFYSRKTDLPVDARYDTPESLANALKIKWDLELAGGVLVANPIPKEHAIDGHLMEKHIQSALKEAEKAGIKGKAITPYLLSRLEVLTAGKSLDANVELVKSNAILAAQIATAWCELEKNV